MPSVNMRTITTHHTPNQHHGSCRAKVLPRNGKDPPAFTGTVAETQGGSLQAGVVIAAPKVSDVCH